MELFAVYDRRGRQLGLRPRQEVHARGLWHKSAQVFVFNRGQRLLIQQRAAHKDLYAGLWDYSVGEHLKPGETFVAGARRGLVEELGIGMPRDLVELGGRRFVEKAGKDYVDREIHQEFRCRYDGEIIADPAEVAGVRYIDAQTLAACMARNPAAFTPWFIADIEEFSLLETGPDGTQFRTD